ncbi:unnamed protein product [Darwinula stevensoni]|uniref:Uncharacterized protein n=1 Tax=Darwinula stevensoni TaxID=69355 RepID=A0A7R9ACS2_9CRUS|nr:unnamed protein product [Darwinula stevensoni]CAG0900348.1 unnamed protein product [Darwinula stevensoni]
MLEPSDPAEKWFTTEGSFASRARFIFCRRSRMELRFEMESGVAKDTTKARWTRGEERIEVKERTWALRDPPNGEF